MSHKIVFDHRTSLETIDDIAKQIGSVSLLDKPSRLLIVPDNLSASRLKEYLTAKGLGLLIGNLHISTFEDLSSLIVGQDAEILDTELLGLIILAAVKQLSDDISVNVQTTLGTENPEDSSLVKALTSEFVEYSSFVSPKFRNRQAVMDEIGQFLIDLPNPLGTRAQAVLEFYRSVEEVSESIQKGLDTGESVYLTRAHLVSEACRMLQDRPLEEFIEAQGIDEIYVVGNALFDMTVLDLIVLLILRCKKFVLNATPEITSRLRHRLEYRLGNSVEYDIETEPPRKKPWANSIEAFSIPDKRREVELAAVQCARLVSNGTPPDKILLVSRLASDYSPYFASVFQEYGLPSFMQIRTQIVFSPVYRLIESILTLLSLEEDSKVISAQQISAPLRLGFTVSTVKDGKRTRREFRVTDRRFLAIETELERIEKYEQKKSLEAWLERIEKYQEGQSSKKIEYIYRPMTEILEWVRKESDKPNVEPLISLIKAFIRVYGTQKEFPVLSLVPSGRFNLTREHISSQAERILTGLYSLRKQQKRVAGIRLLLGSQEKEIRWRDVLRAYRTLVGGMSYGEVHRDSDAIRFVDAGISHFIQTEHRIIIGLTSDQFPRKYPEPLLIFPEMRASLNRQEKGYFISSPETHLEIERYFFETAKARARKLTYSMNYLDDRGHRQLWSYFVQKGEEETNRIGAHEIRVELSSALLDKKSPKILSVNTALFDFLRKKKKRELDELSLGLLSLLPEDQGVGVSLERVAINTSLTALKRRVIDQAFYPQLGLGLDIYEPNVFDGERVPALWELDLSTYCPAMYYFYVFYHFLPNMEWIRKQGLDSVFYFVPAWKTTDHRFGPVPLPLWRTQISTEGCKWLEEVAGYSSFSPTELLELEAQIDDLSVSPAEKTSLKGLVSILNELGEFKLKPPRKSSSYGPRIYRPPLGRPLKGQAANNIFFKLRPYEPIDRTHIVREGTKRWVKIQPVSSRGAYGSFEKTHSIEHAVKSVRDLEHYEWLLQRRQGSEMPLNKDLCLTCVYRTLCGRWGF